MLKSNSFCSASWRVTTGMHKYKYTRVQHSMCLNLEVPDKLILSTLKKYPISAMVSVSAHGNLIHNEFVAAIHDTDTDNSALKGNSGTGLT